MAAVRTLAPQGPTDPPLQGFARRFRLVDFAATRQPHFRNHVVSVEQVRALLDRYGPDDCFSSIFFFSHEILLYLEEHRVAGRPSLAGYDGPVWAPFLPIDIDGEPSEQGAEQALAMARATVALLRSRWQVPEAALHVYFSGAKGFHVLIDTRVFGRVPPANDLHRVFSYARAALACDLPTFEHARFDLSIGDKVRLLRLPNTRHSRSLLFKVPLELEELDRLAMAEIRQLAVSPRPLRRTAYAGLLPTQVVTAVSVAHQLLQRARREARRYRVHPYRLPTPPSSAEEALCPARQAMASADVPVGLRNNVAIRLASALRRAGYQREFVTQFLLDWNHRLHHPLPEREVLAVVRSAFARPYPYNYGCHDEVIRSFCPFREHLLDCEFYRAQHRKAGGLGEAGSPTDT